METSTLHLRSANDFKSLDQIPFSVRNEFSYSGNEDHKKLDQSNNLRERVNFWDSDINLKQDSEDPQTPDLIARAKSVLVSPTNDQGEPSSDTCSMICRLVDITFDEGPGKNSGPDTKNAWTNSETSNPFDQIMFPDSDSILRFTDSIDQNMKMKHTNYSSDEVNINNNNNNNMSNNIYIDNSEIDNKGNNNNNNNNNIGSHNIDNNGIDNDNSDNKNNSNNNASTITNNNDTDTTANNTDTIANNSNNDIIINNNNNNYTITTNNNNYTITNNNNNNYTITNNNNNNNYTITNNNNNNYTITNNNNNNYTITNNNNNTNTTTITTTTTTNTNTNNSSNNYTIIPTTTTNNNNTATNTNINNNNITNNSIVNNNNNYNISNTNNTNTNNIVNNNNYTINNATTTTNNNNNNNNNKRKNNNDNNSSSANTSISKITATNNNTNNNNNNNNNKNKKNNNYNNNNSSDGSSKQNYHFSYSRQIPRPIHLNSNGLNYLIDDFSQGNNDQSNFRFPTEIQSSSSPNHLIEGNNNFNVCYSTLPQDSKGDSGLSIDPNLMFYSQYHNQEMIDFEKKSFDHYLANEIFPCPKSESITSEFSTHFNYGVSNHFEIVTEPVETKPCHYSERNECSFNPTQFDSSGINYSKSENLTNSHAKKQDNEHVIYKDLQIEKEDNNQCQQRFQKSHCQNQLGPYYHPFEVFPQFTPPPNFNYNCVPHFDLVDSRNFTVKNRFDQACSEKNNFKNLYRSKQGCIPINDRLAQDQINDNIYFKNKNSNNRPVLKNTYTNYASNGKKNRNLDSSHPLKKVKNHYRSSCYPDFCQNLDSGVPTDINSKHCISNDLKLCNSSNRKNNCKNLNYINGNREGSTVFNDINEKIKYVKKVNDHSSNLEKIPAYEHTSGRVVNAGAYNSENQISFERRSIKNNKSSSNMNANNSSSSSTSNNNNNNNKILKGPNNTNNYAECLIKEKCADLLRRIRIVNANEGFKSALKLALNENKFLPHSSHCKILLELAEMAKRENFLKDSRYLYQKSTLFFPYEPKVWLEWAKMEKESGSLENCEKVMMSALSYCGLHSEALLLRTIRILESRGKYNQFRDLLGIILQASCNNMNQGVNGVAEIKEWRIFLEGAMLEWRIGRPKIAHAILDYLKNLLPNRMQPYLYSIELLKKESRYMDAYRTILEGLDRFQNTEMLWIKALQILQQVISNGHLTDDTVSESNSKDSVISSSKAMDKFMDSTVNTDKDEIKKKSGRSIFYFANVPKSSEEFYWVFLPKFVQHARENLSSEFIWKFHLQVAALYEMKSGPKFLVEIRRNCWISIQNCPVNLQWRIWLIAAHTELNIGSEENARKLLIHTAKVVPKKMQTTILLELSKLEEYLGYLDRAKYILNRVKIGSRLDWKVFLDYILLQMRAGDLESAIKEARDALKIHPTTGRLWAILIQVYHWHKYQNFAAEGFELTLKSFQEALKEVPKSGEVWCEGARIAMHMGYLEYARKYLEFAIELTPQYGDTTIEFLRLEMLEYRQRERLKGEDNCSSKVNSSDSLYDKSDYKGSSDNDNDNDSKSEKDEYLLDPDSPLRWVFGSDRLAKNCSNSKPNYGPIWSYCKSAPHSTCLATMKRGHEILLELEKSDPTMDIAYHLLGKSLNNPSNVFSKEEKRKLIFFS